MRYRVVLAYDGTDYAGWQEQAAEQTIQGCFEEVLGALNGSRVVAHAAGRTDAGVHAEGQVVSIEVRRDWEPSSLLRALNGNLPRDIRVLEVEPASDDFHARYHARGKTYRYRIITSRIMNPFQIRYAWHYPFRLDEARLHEELGHLLGTHDFKAFTVSSCEVRTTVRTLTGVSVDRDGDRLEIGFSGSGFLRYQVRTMVGALVEMARGRLSINSMPELIARRDRTLAGAAAPARGLTLMKVEY